MTSVTNPEECFKETCREGSTHFTTRLRRPKNNTWIHKIKHFAFEKDFSFHENLRIKHVENYSNHLQWLENLHIKHF